MSVTLIRNSGGVGDARTFGGQTREMIGTFKYAANYAAGGEALNTDSFLAGPPDFVALAPTGGYVFEYVKSTGKVKAWATSSSGMIEVTAGTDLTALEIPFLAKRYM
jgi:hypothetical protein